jgi:uncharacterized protein (TIGR02246 family)
MIDGVEEIKNEIARWNRLIRARDLEGIAQLYATDAVLLSPGRPAAVGRDAIREVWHSLMTSTTFAATIELLRGEAIGRDCVVDCGRVRLTGASPGGGEAWGKYLVVWRRRDDRWSVGYDCFNMDA